MKLSEHLDKGIWTIADKALLLLYGFGVIIVVVNVLPKEEWGAWSLYQSIFLILSVLADSIFLQPMVKFGSEHEAEVHEVLAAGFNLYSIAMIAASVTLWLYGPEIGSLFASKEVSRMLPLLPIWVLASILRNVGIRYLQIDLRISSIFWVDLGFFGSILILTVMANALGMLHTAADFLYLNIAGGIISSIITLWFCARAFLKMPIFTVPRHEYARMMSFVKFHAGTSALLTIQQWSDVLVVGYFFGLKEAGIYNAAKVIFRFLDAVREGATLLVVPLTSRLFSEKNYDALAALLEKLLFIGFAVLVPVSLVLALGSWTLFHFVYKAQYDAASPVFQILILSGFTMPLSLVGTNALIGMGRAKSLFFVTVVSTAIFFGLSYLLTPALASKGQALAVFGALTSLSVLQFFAMRSGLDLSAAGIMRRASDARRFVRERAKGITTRTEIDE